MFAFAVSSFPVHQTSKTHSSLSPRNPLKTPKRFLGSSLRATPPSRIVHSHPQFQILKCYSDSPEHDQEDDDEDEEQVEIILTDPDTNRTLPAEVEHTIFHKGNTYLLCFPVDDPVTFATASDDNVLDPITDQHLLQEMFPNAQAVLSEEHIVLKNSAFFPTVDDQSEDLAEGEDDDDDEDDLEHTEKQPDEDDVEVIAEFLYDGRQHFVVRPVDVIMLVAQVLEEGYRVLRGEELGQVSPIVEEFIENTAPPTP